MQEDKRSKKIAAVFIVILMLAIGCFGFAVVQVNPVHCIAERLRCPRFPRPASTSHLDAAEQRQIALELVVDEPGNVAVWFAESVIRHKHSILQRGQGL